MANYKSRKCRITKRTGIEFSMAIYPIANHFIDHKNARSLTVRNPIHHPRETILIEKNAPRARGTLDKDTAKLGRQSHFNNCFLLFHLLHNSTFYEIFKGTLKYCICLITNLIFLRSALYFQKDAIFGGFYFYLFFILTHVGYCMSCGYFWNYLFITWFRL